MKKRIEDWYAYMVAPPPRTWNSKRDTQRSNRITVQGRILRFMKWWQSHPFSKKYPEPVVLRMATHADIWIGDNVRVSCFPRFCAIQLIDHQPVLRCGGAGAAAVAMAYLGYLSRKERGAVAPTMTVEPG